MIQLDIKPGDTILTGKFKNKKVVVKSITKDEYGNPLINGKQIMKIRVPKLYQQNENTKMKKSELRQIIREEILNEENPKKHIMREINELFDNWDLHISEFEYQNNKGWLTDEKFNKLKSFWKNFEKAYITYIKSAIKWDNSIDK